jgi:hypothetical protein
VEWTAETEELTLTLELKCRVVHASMPKSSTSSTPDGPGRPRRLGQQPVLPDPADPSVANPRQAAQG